MHDAQVSTEPTKPHLLVDWEISKYTGKQFDWQSYWQNTGDMGVSLRELFSYTMGQNDDLALIIDSLQNQKYLKKFENLPLLLRACVAYWSDDMSGPAFARGGMAPSFAKQWHHLLTTPGLKSFRDEADPHAVVGGIIKTVMCASRTQPQTQEAVLKWTRDTLELAPLHWIIPRESAFVLWTQASPEEQRVINGDWAVHYDICPDKTEFLSYVHSENQQAIEKSKEDIQVSMSL